MITCTMLVCIYIYATFTFPDLEVGYDTRIFAINSLAIIIAVMCCREALKINNVTSFDIVIIWALMLASYYDAIYLEINAVGMLLIVILACINMARQEFNRSYIIVTAIIIVIFVILNIMSLIGLADTFALVGIASIFYGSIERLVVSLWIATVLLAVHILYNKKKKISDCAPYIPWLTSAMLLVITT